MESLPARHHRGVSYIGMVMSAVIVAGLCWLSATMLPAPSPASQTPGSTGSVDTRESSNVSGGGIPSRSSQQGLSRGVASMPAVGQATTAVAEATALAVANEAQAAGAMHGGVTADDVSQAVADSGGATQLVRNVTAGNPVIELMASGAHGATTVCVALSSQLTGTAHVVAC